MQDHYEINVSHYGSHFFATAPRSCVSETQMNKVFREIKNRFPESEGFKVTVTYYTVKGREVHPKISR